MSFINGNKPLVSILYRDHAGIWAPLDRLYYSTSSKILVSRHPMVSIEEVISTYCPQCLTRYNDEETTKLNNRCPTCFQCPHCKGILVRKSKESVAGAMDMNLVCTTCGWATIQPIFDSNKMLNVKKNDNFFNDLFAAFEESNHDADQDQTFKIWRLEDLEAKISTNSNKDYNIDYFSSHQKEVNSHGSQAVMEKYDEAMGIPLRTKKTLRCRHDYEVGKMNILIQTKQSPLDGDSSMKLQKGKWWIKDSSAVHDFPHLSVIGLGQCGDHWFIDVRIVNPKDSDAIITLRTKLDIERDTFDCDELGNFQYRSIRSVMSPVDCLEDGISLTLRGYEDELLKEEMEESESSQKFESVADDTKWPHYVEGNKGFIRIPVCDLRKECTNCLPLNILWKINGCEVTAGVKISVSF